MHVYTLYTHVHAKMDNEYTANLLSRYHDYILIYVYLRSINLHYVRI